MRILRFRVSLRTFLIATTIVGVALGLTIRRYVVERSAEERLVQNGLSLSFYPWGEAVASSGRTTKITSEWNRSRLFPSESTGCCFDTSDLSTVNAPRN